MVREIRDYQIAFVGLKPGVHHFNYEVDDAFFSSFQQSLVPGGRVFVDLSFDKKDRLFVLNFDISGIVKTECDRCTAPLDLPIHGNYTMYVKVGDRREQDVDSEEVMWIFEGESLLDVSDLIYQFIHLALPIQKVHPQKSDGTTGCDPKMLQLIKTLEPKTETDSRWDVLSNLNKN
jgi:uncharacterized metal-binding protein YceD (DUF177 family)